MGAEVKESLKLYRKYIINIIRPSYVLDFMGSWMSESIIDQIKAEEAKGPTAAAKLFVDELLDLEAEGWYQGLIDGLRAAEYEGLSRALADTDFADIESLDEHKQRLNVIRATVTCNIDPKEVVPDLAVCLIKREVEEILQETRTNGPTSGAQKLVDCLLRSDKKEWPKTFTLVLEDYECEEVLQLWKGDTECQNEKKMSTDDPGEVASPFMMIQFTEEPVLDNQCLSAPGEPEPEQDCEHTTKPAKMISPPVSIKAMKLRKYQEELAQPAYRGNNTIISAPTGCGKTFVALSICDHHLKSMPNNQKGKVVFMATKVPVYEQQKNIFHQYFEDTGYSVTGFCGEQADNIPIGMVIEQSDIIILTPQILVNCLEDGLLSSLSIFTLMIFDECHNTIGNHPYNVLMFKYLDQKLDSPGQKLPQIVGLTASVGTGKSRCAAEAVEYISKLCSSLDIECISTVKESLEELRKVVYKPEKFVHEARCRMDDPFAKIMSEIMTEIEQMAKSVYPNLGAMSDIQNRTIGTQKYDNWIIDIQKKCRLLQLEDKMEESRLCSALFTYTEHLRKCNNALIINEDARTHDALDYLQNFYNNIKNGTFTDIEQNLVKKFEVKLPQLLEIAKDNENPKLEELQFILSESYRENPETRTLLFVNTRALVAALKKWIEETPSLSFLKPETIFGRSKRHDNIGMTLPSQKGALDTFRNSGDNKLLIATSVADEGIDIPACNLVLLYEYVGNVTKMIQVRGRGRAKDSKCYLITSKHEQAEKEEINLLHEVLMNNAVAVLQKKDRTEFIRQNLHFQREEKRLRDFKKNFKGPLLSKENKRLLCGRCKTFACDTDNIRLINKSHHTVIDRSFKDKYFTREHSKPVAFGGFHKKYKIFCKNPKCGDDWGISGNYLSFQNIPLIKIDKFVVENANGSQAYFKKWVKVDFSIKEFNKEEIDESFSTQTD
ncbi:antiviral innate immune response receptor RIG-I [Rana temporaria]|uniref:antiviral innate immune response receptor RIG-I n=1 Tax=Rana temporaria TaxID=8407 RepID=UPI001AACAB5D|nr:antiviral innate immune response receptor RIG-I [Rana temporaria]